jgi:hypothetical protein
MITVTELLSTIHVIQKQQLIMEEQLINLAAYMKEIEERLITRENYSPIINELWAEQRLRALEEFVKGQKDYYKSIGQILNG